MSDNIKRLTFRMPLNLYGKIDTLAKQNRRSLNSEIIYALEQYCEKHLSADEEPIKPKNE